MAGEERQTVRYLVAALPERERRVIERRFGLGDAEIWTLQQLANELAVTPQAVRRIEIRALKRLQGAMLVFV